VGARLLTLLPDDLDATARGCGAFYTPGGIATPATLLRLCLAYATGPSAEAVVAWARQTGVADLAQEHLLEHLARSRYWLAYLVGQVLEAAPTPAGPLGPWRVRLLDATLVQRPGSTQPDCRLHVGFNLATGQLDHLALTDHTVGDRLVDFPCATGDLVIVDRGYASRGGVAAARATGAHVLVRL
jgi:hypothetical protein